MAQNNKNSVRTTERSLDIIETVQSLNGARLTELAEALDLPNSTVHNHLATLVERGYLVKQNNQYHVSLQFLDIGEYARRSRRGYEAARQELERLARETGETAMLMTEENDRGVILYTSSGTEAAPLGFRPGTELHLHASALGRAYLAYLPRDRIEDVISATGLPAVTDDTVSHPDELLSELDEIRTRGYATDCGESQRGVRGVASAVRLEYRIVIFDRNYPEIIFTFLGVGVSEVDEVLAEFFVGDGFVVGNKVECRLDTQRIRRPVDNRV